MSGVLVSIDRIDLLPPLTPVGLDVIPSGFSEHPLPGGGMVIFEEQTPSTIILKFGNGGVSEEAQRALEILRTRNGLHLLGIQDLSCDRIAYLNVYVPRPPRNAQNLGADQHLVFGDYDLPCKQLDLWPKLVRIDMHVHGTITTGDGKYKFWPEAPGRIIAIDGFIQDSGSGGGSTSIQVSYGATDLLATPGVFFAAGVGYWNILYNAVLIDAPSFAKGLAPIELDIDSTVGGANASNMVVTLWCMMFSP